MKNKKLILGTVIGIVVAIVALLVIVIFNNKIKYKNFEEESDNETDANNSKFISQLTLSSGKKIDLNIPDGFKNTTNNDTYMVFEQEGITIYIEAVSDTNIDEYLTIPSVDDEENRCYLTNSQNCSTSERKSITINNKNYYYQDIYSEYQSFIPIKWYEKKIWIDLNDVESDCFTIRISSENYVIDDSLVEKILSIY